MPVGMSQEPSNVIAIPAHWYGTPAHARRAAAPAVRTRPSQNELVAEIFGEHGDGPSYRWFLEQPAQVALMKKYEITDLDVMAVCFTDLAEQFGLADDADWKAHMNVVLAAEPTLPGIATALYEAQSFDRIYCKAVLNWLEKPHDMERFSHMQEATTLLKSFYIEQLGMPDFEAKDIAQGLYHDCRKIAAHYGYEQER
jgi:hypothetical protein